MVLKNSVMNTKQFFCLAIRQSFRNLFEKYMELKEKEEKVNVKETNKIILAGYMNINPRYKAIENHSLPINPKIYTLSTIHDVETISLIIVLMRNTKHIVKWIKNNLLGILGIV